MATEQLLPCCGGRVNEAGQGTHEEWCPSHIRAALTWIDSSLDGAGFRQRAEVALDALIERDGLVKHITVSDVMPLARFLYQNASVGCCLHLPIANGDMDNESLRKSLQAAQMKGHAHCETLARVLLRMTEAQRDRVSRTARKQ